MVELVKSIFKIVVVIYIVYNENNVAFHSRYLSCRTKAFLNLLPCIADFGSINGA
jgi:type III secretory pathway component EscU